MKNLPKISCILCLGFAVGNLSAQTDSNFNFTGTEQTWTVPCGVTQLTVIAVGGAGGGDLVESTTGGNGATITGVVPVTPGDVIDIYVAGAGVTNINDDGGAGGGGTFIYDSTAGKLLEVAGGGGGSYYENINGLNASVDTVPNGTNGGVGQGGGRATRYDGGGGGASFIHNGATNGNDTAGTGGYDRANGFAGGVGDVNGSDGYCMGGYGGGGGCGWDGGGGGGGYNGGGVDTAIVGYDPGGGGSSYVLANDTLSTMDTNTGNGIVTFIYDSLPFVVSGNVINNVSCNGENNASVSAISLSGGGPPFTYSWTPGGESSDTVTGLAPGSYTVNVTDGCGGTATASVAVTQPNVLTAAVSMPMNVSCNGNSNGRDTAIAGGGTAPYTYSWAPSGGTGAIGVGLSAGSYTVTVIDKNGCNATASATITQPADLHLIMRIINALGNPCNGGASVSVTGGTAPYTYSWTGGGTNDSIAGKCVGDYCCTVTDKNGCADTACIYISNVTGIANISGSGEVTVYPNPNNGQFTMQLPSADQQLSVEIYNVLGEKVYSQLTTNNSQFTIKLNQPNGIYLYRVISGSGTLVGQGKIMLQK